MGDEGDRQMEAKRKRMLFRRAAAQMLWVVGMTDKCRGQRERVRYLVGQRADMNILRESAQLKKSTYLISYSVSHLQRISCSLLIDVLQVCCLFDVCTTYKVQNIEIFTVSESVTHSKPFSKRSYRFVVCLLSD